MLVKNGDILVRGEQPYEAICADEKCFVIAEVTVNPDDPDFNIHVNYENLEAYTNDESVNTLSDLNFTKSKEE